MTTDRDTAAAQRAIEAVWRLESALIIAGRNAAGRVAPSKRDAAKFGDAFKEYCSYLEARAQG